MNNKEFVAKLIEVATKTKTLYVMGCFGAPMNKANKARYITHHSYNKRADRTKMINSATADTFGFDCVCLIKGILWGFCADKSKTYGGAVYKSNGVPDINANSFIKECHPTTDFTTIEVGEAVWIKGHIGVYVGNGQVVECTPKWTNNVQISYLGNKPEYKKGNYRVWSQHGKIPYITYEAVEVNAPVTPQKPTETEKPVTPTENPSTPFKVGDTVRIAGERYNPASSRIPAWVKNDYTHIVTQITYKGKKVYKGGKECVLLGKRVKNGSTLELAGINTWVAIENLTLVNPSVTYRTHTVVKGDSLWRIASKLLGKGSRYPEIKKLNGLTSNTIYVGQVLKIPN